VSGSVVSLSQEREAGPRPAERPPRQFLWAKAAAITFLIVLIYRRVVIEMAADWWNDPTLAQGMLIPPLALYVAWLRRHLTWMLPAAPDNRGLLLAAAACMTFIVGKLGAEFFLMRFSLVMLLAGIVWTFWGYRRLRSLALPFLLLATMIPLPVVVYNSLSTPLQLFASDVSVAIARAFGVTVYLEGNIISLANTTLGVADACSGLTSLSSLAVAGPLLAVSLCTRMRTRLLLMSLAIPVAIGVNIVRITGTALLADARHEFALGFYHVFSGWLVFVIGLLALYAIAKVLHACMD
jgi:exosortase